MSACPTLLIAAPASGSGKTSVTAALARLHARQGRRVQVFKCGPDFLDPQILAAASGRPVQTLDLGMCGEADAAWRLARATQDSDLILVEGVMGLFDGMPSAADLAERFNLPVLAVIDAQAMAQTFAALAFGLARYRPHLPFAGVLANRVGSARHAEILRDSLPADLPWYGALAHDPEATLPERHLGLRQASEIDDLMTRLDRLADALATTRAAELPPAVVIADAPAPVVPPLLAGRRIAIARDAAFAFIYPANLEIFTRLGATLVFFSPLAGESLPDCDAVWLPGGYPELFAARLAERGELWAALTAHVAAGRPLLAECGGMMALHARLVDIDGAAHRLAGLIPGTVAMQQRLAALGTQFADLPEGRLSGHTFHYSQSTTPLPPIARAQTADGRPGEAIYRERRLTASYVHFYFPSNPEAAAGLFLP
jgi:cobyrinic acid a,c-diamide synthase